MCGICGVIQIGGEARRVLAPDVLDRMTDVMAHRGPYDRGTHSAEGVAMGARRLPLVDIERGHQPFANEDGQVWAALNGMIYNHDKLREELRLEGHSFTSVCDTEVLPHVYEQVGDTFTELLRGEFAIVVWDGRRRRAVLARDRLGMKPLHYAVRDDLVVFASELKSLLASGIVDPALDYEAIDAYLVFGYIPGPRTLLEGVRKLPAGHRLVIDSSGFREERFWAFPAPTATAGVLSEDECAAGLLEELDESVRLRMIADVPVGAMLSGGIDSSVIVALMAQHAPNPVKTFSIGFAELGDEANELADARLVASAFGTNHHEVELSLGDAVDLAELVWHLDEPLEDLSALGLLAISEFASGQVTAALSGMGPDELLGGYRKHRAAALCRGWDALPPSIRKAGARLAPHARGRLRRAVRTLTAQDPASRLVAMSGKLDAEARRRLVRGPLAELDGTAALRAVRQHLDGIPEEPLAATLYLDGQLDMVDHMLTYIDRASMAHSLDLRAPFLDHHVVEYAATIPSRFKVRRLETKHVLKRAARGLIPDEVIEKRKRGFFRDSMDAWLRAQLHGALSNYLLVSSPRYAEFLERAEVERLVREQAKGSRGRNVHLLLSVLLLEVWLQTYLPRALGAPAPPREQIRVGA